MFLKHHCIRKLKYVAFSLLFVACAERPVYEPAPKTETNVGQPKSSTEKTGTAGQDKAADATNTMTPANQTPPAVSPTPTPTPTPPAAAPVEPVGVAATGRTLVTANCIAMGCHGSTPMDAKNEVMLAAGTNIPAHPVALKNMGFFIRPAAGMPATNFSHVVAYLKTTGAAPIMGPNIP